MRVRADLGVRKRIKGACRATCPRLRFTPPTLRERRHRSLARRLIAVPCACDCARRVAARPHPGAILRNDRLLMIGPPPLTRRDKGYPIA
jgi:hypothetical protein